MKPAPFDYHTPTTVDEAVNLLSSLENAKVLAGGQSLVPMMNFRFVIPDHIVDLRLVDGLSGIRETETGFRIGAMTTQRDVEFDKPIARRTPLFPAALAHVGHRQTRNRGTIGGSLSHADPAAETPAVLMALDAELTVTGSSGTRTVPIREFAQGFMATTLAEDEILVAIDIEAWAEGHGASFKEFARRHGDFAVVGAGAMIELADDGTVARAAISLCGTGPIRLTAGESILVGQKPTPDVVAACAGTAWDIEAIEDTHASSDYRRHLARVLSERAIAEAATRAHRGKSL